MKKSQPSLTVYTLDGKFYLDANPDNELFYFFERDLEILGVPFSLAEVYETLETLLSHKYVTKQEINIR